MCIRDRSFVYELAFAIEGDGNRPVMAGLIDVEKLGGYKYDANFAGVKAENAGLESENAGPKRGQNGGVAGGSRGKESPVSIGVQDYFCENPPENTTAEETEEDAVVAAPHRNNGRMKGGN